jgi:hypothetical protein
VFGHDQNDSNGILITVNNSLGSNVFGDFYQDQNGNSILEINLSADIFDDCGDGCNALVSVIAHELGHTLGLADIDGGCETSIMSHDRDRNVVTGPSSDDLCWFWHYHDSQGGGGGDCQYCLEHDHYDMQTLPFVGDSTGQRRQGFGGAVGGGVDLVAIVKLSSVTSFGDQFGNLVRRFDAEVLDVIKTQQAVTSGDEIAFIRIENVGWLLGSPDQPPQSLTPGSTLVLCLAWDDRLRLYVQSIRGEAMARSVLAAVLHR